MKTTKKRILAFMLLLCFMICFAVACDENQNNEETTADTSEKASPESETTGKESKDSEAVVESNEPTETTAKPTEPDPTEATTKPDELVEPHVHIYGEWKTVKEPTCTGDGEKERTCACGEKEISTISKKAHNYVDGMCKDCGDVKVSEGLMFSTDSFSESWSVCGFSSCNDKYIAIPSEYAGKPVTSISAQAFSGCTELLSVTIPDSITSIGDFAFSGCTNLLSVIIPDSITSIGNFTFSGCEGLTSVNIPDSVTSIGFGAFSGCSGLTTIPVAKGVSQILNNTFSGCTGLTSVVIPDNITFIDFTAFHNCTGLTSVTIPSSVTFIGDNTFGGCENLSSITLPFAGQRDGVDGFGRLFGAYDREANTECVPKSLKTVIITGGSSICDYAFYGCTGLTSITIPNSVTNIGVQAFAWCTSLASITVEAGNSTYHSVDNCLIETSSNTIILGCKNSVIPVDGSVTSIGDYAFYRCIDLVSITIPNGVTSIGANAFLGCKSLANIDILGNITNIGDSAFAYCENLERIILPDSVTSAGWGSFRGCTSLTSITIPNGLVSLDTQAFYGCSSLTSITIGDNLMSMSDSAFQGCNNIMNITVSPNNMNYRFVNNCLINTSSYTLVLGCINSIIPTDGSVIIANIGRMAFKGRKDLTSITIPNSVINIGERAFNGCSNLTSIKFEGTKAQWEEINKDDNWDKNTGSYTVYCIDGNISK